MTDRLKGCTVVFEHDTRDDDAEGILNAIRMVKGVLSVAPDLAMPADWGSDERARIRLGREIFDLIYPKGGQK
jgi:hypothetical protein